MVLSPLLFSGSSNLNLANKIAQLLNLSLGKRDIHFFPDKEIFVEILEPVQARDIFVIQSLFNDPNIHLMELLIMVDALKRAGAESITAVLPYFGYARQDRLIRPGMSITAKLVADLLTCSGITKIITLDLHSDQIEGFFDIPVEHLTSRSLLANYCRNFNLDEAVIVAPDKGGVKIASEFSRELNLPMAMIDKERLDPYNVEMRFFIGNVANKTVILTDDMCSTAGTLINAAKTCHELGANKIFALVGHALFVKNALVHLEESVIEKIITTDSVSSSSEIKKHNKIHVLSVAPLFAQAINH